MPGFMVDKGGQKLDELMGPSHSQLAIDNSYQQVQGLRSNKVQELVDKRQ